MMAFALTLVACDALLLPTVGRAPRAGVFMVERKANEFEKVALMPQELSAWGCDDELWDSLRSKGRKSLKQLLRNGNEEMARERIARLREAVAVELEARRAADYLCAGNEECATELTAKLVSEEAAKTEDAKRSSPAVETTSEITAEGDKALTTTESVDATAKKSKEVGTAEEEAPTAAVEAAVPTGFEWGGTF